MKHKISRNDIIVRIALLFAWFPIGILLLIKSKSIKHKGCIAFIYFCLNALILPIIGCILISVVSIVDGQKYGSEEVSQMLNLYNSSGSIIVMLIISLAIYGVVLIVDKGKKDKVKQTNFEHQIQNIQAYQKAELLTEREKNFYETIRLIAEKYNYAVLSKVRFADIVNVDEEALSKNSPEWWRNFNKISRKHIDFALAEKQNLNVKLLIEIDDSTHQRNDRIDRDNFVDMVCQQVNIPILHLYDVVGLDKKIENILHCQSSEGDTVYG